jgi:hypothetical protein
MIESLSKNILATICYYDCLNFPLTAFEVWKNLIDCNRPSTKSQEAAEGETNHSLSNVVRELEGNDSSGLIEEFQGFYFLKGRKELVSQRIERNKVSVGKIKRLKRYIKILRYVPFVRMVAITGRLAMKNAEGKSDWDVLVVLEKGRIWIGRTLVTFMLQILGKRRHGNKIKNRVCLNHFLTTASLEIKLQDLFSAHEYSYLMPVFDTGIFNKFQIRNSWIRDLRPNYGLSELYPKGIIANTKATIFFRGWPEKIFNSDWLEEKLRTWQQKKITRNPKTSQIGSYIEATDEALVFLPEPQGPKIYECYIEKLKRFSL